MSGGDEADEAEEAEPQLPDFGALLGQAQEALAAQAEAATQVVEGQSGGGVVKVEVTGGGEFRSVTIDPQVVDPADVEMLQDLILAALHDASAQIAELQQEAMGGLDIGGLLGE
jgi:nucleoid-associated protein EbfC